VAEERGTGTHRGPGLLSAEAIREARARIPPEFLDSPQFVSDELSELAARRVVVKVDAVNPVGAFKGRGAWLAVEELQRRTADGPPFVVVASTGNFGQAVAYAGRSFGVGVTVFANEGASPLKLERIRRFGAQVRVTGHDFDAAREAAAAYARDHKLLLLTDGEDPWIAIGAGTLAMELTGPFDRYELPRPAAAYIPVGNGALIAGVGTWLREASPQTRVIGVQSERAPSMTRSWLDGRPIATDTADTRAGGIATRVPVPEALEMMRDVVDDMILVSEEAIAQAQRVLRRALGLTVELAAAASWAGLLAAPPPGEGPALILITGTNEEEPDAP
jgi:threonine dehydratase